MRRLALVFSILALAFPSLAWAPNSEDGGGMQCNYYTYGTYAWFRVGNVEYEHRCSWNTYYYWNPTGRYRFV